MTEPNVEERVAALLATALDVGLPNKVAEWQASLRERVITPEMRAVFVAMGWLVPDGEPMEATMAPTPSKPAGGPTEPVDLDLTTVNGNVFAVIAAVSRALRRAGATPEYVTAVKADMMSADYDHALQVAIRETSAD